MHKNGAVKKSYQWGYQEVSATRVLPSIGNIAQVTCLCLRQLTIHY